MQLFIVLPGNYVGMYVWYRYLVSILYFPSMNFFLHCPCRHEDPLYTGGSAVLPHWEEEPISLLETRVEQLPWRHTTTIKTGHSFQFTFRDSTNTRKFLFELLARLLG